MISGSTSLEKNSDVCEVLMTWWKSLENERGDRADLRRCHDIVEVMFNPAYHRLWYEMNKIGFGKVESVALIAAVLSHVKVNRTEETVAAQMASLNGGSNPQVSGLRFKRLLKIKGMDELFSPIIRVVKLLDGNVNICNLAYGLYWWSDLTKKEWAFSYYEKAPGKNN